MYSCGLLTVSDSSFYNKADDISGKYLKNIIESLNSFVVSVTEIVPDEIQNIKQKLIEWSDEKNLSLIITTGGTGFTARDVTPEATMTVIDKNAQSISQALLIGCMKITPFAVLSRGISGIRGSTLIINLPGSPKAVKECIDLLNPFLLHAMDQLSEKTDKVKNMHRKMQNKSISTVVVSDADVAGRSRWSRFPLVNMDDAQQLVFSKVKSLPYVMMEIIESLNMVTSEAVLCRVNVPPFRASIKDGYAVRFADKSGIRQIVSVSNAGDVKERVLVGPGCCARISTGAQVPDGADAVVQVEDTELIVRDEETGAEKSVNIKIAPSELGQDIRPIGNDMRVGDVIIDKGTVIGPSEIGSMAMGGVSMVEVIRQPVVGVMSTGNELITHTSQELTEKILDCNRPMLMSLYRSHHFVVKDLGIVPDQPDELLNGFLSALKSCDVIVTTGGVSMGEKDYVQAVLQQDLNAEIHFGRIFMKPGKPTTFSTICNEHTKNERKVVFSLPGNPVSAFVTSYLFVIPALKKMAGLGNFEIPIMSAKLQHSLKLDPRPEYRRCRILSKSFADGTVEYEVSTLEFGNQMSSRLASCIQADGLICLPSATEFVKSLEAGSVVSVLKL